MKIPQDKIKHFLVGLAVAVFAAAVWFVAAQFGLVGMSSAWLAAVLCATVAGVTKEAADHLGNKIVPGMHGVEWLDAFATAAGSIPVAAVFLLNY